VHAVLTCTALRGLTVLPETEEPKQKTSAGETVLPGLVTRPKPVDTGFFTALLPPNGHKNSASFLRRRYGVGFHQQRYCF